MSDEFKDEQVKALGLASAAKETSVELLKRFPEASVYGLLLNSDPNHPLSKVLSKHWSELHYLTGSQVILLAFQPPTSWSENLKDYWKKQLGGKFETTWKEWQTPLDAGVAFDYLDLFEKPEIKASQLPCLVLFTDLIEREAVVRSIPDWDEDSLYRFLLGIFADIRECAKQPADHRLESLRSSLTSLSVRASAQLGHVADRTKSYLIEHPAQIVTASLSFVLALTTGGVLPLGAGVVTFLTVLRDTISKYV